MKIVQSIHVPENIVSMMREYAKTSQKELAFFHSPDLPGLTIIHSIESGDHGTLRHVSISLPRRDPTWAEIKEIWTYFFKEDEDAMMVFPRRVGGPGWVNVHEHCFHLWQMPTVPGPTGKWEYE